MMDARVGVSTYHNVAISAGTGLNTAAEIGIPGANLDEYTSGMTRIEIAAAISNPIAGYSPSLPWDRGETTVHDGRHDDEAVGQPHDQVRRRLPSQRGLPAADAGPGRSARRFTVQREPDRHRRPTPRRRPTSRTRSRRSCSIVPATSAATSRSSEKPGTVYSSMFTFIHDKWQVVAEDDDRPWPAARVLHAARRHRDAGRPVELRSGHQLAARLGLRRHQRSHQRQVELAQFQSALGRVLSLRPTRR